VTNEVYSVEPYASHPGRNRRNDTGGIDDASGLLAVEKAESG